MHRNKMAESNSSSSANSSLEDLVNGVLTHPRFRNVIGNLSSPQSRQENVQSPAQRFESPAEEIRNLFRHGASVSQQQNANSTLTLPQRFNHRFNHVPSRGRNRAHPYRYQNPSSKGKQKATNAPFSREVVLLKNPYDERVVRGSAKAALHRSGNVLNLFEFQKGWSASQVYEKLLYEFPQLQQVGKTPKKVL